MREFNSDSDVWEIIDLIVDETEEANANGGSFNIGESVSAQLSFFSCKNVILDSKSQKDIARYIYSKDFGVPPYKGSYGDQPQKWVEKSWAIKNLIDRQKSKAMKNGNT